MQHYATAVKALSVAFVSASMIACTGGGTSRSSSNQFNDTDSPPVTVKPDELNLSPVSIDQENYYETASMTLKALMLADVTSSALDRSATVSRENGALPNIATGIKINITPFDCVMGGQMKIDGNVYKADPNDDQALNIDNSLNWEFKASFDKCEQPGNRLTGNIDIEFTTNIGELLNSVQYSFDSKMYVADLLIEQVELPAVTVNGSYDYQVVSDDGVTVRTIVSTDDTFLADATDYQSLDYRLDKTVNTETQEYEYVIDSIFSASFLESEYVEYTTIEPLRGTGFAHPSSGKLAVEGADSTLYITAMGNDMVYLELDSEKDGVIDVTEYATWSDMVIDPTAQPEL